MRNLWKLRKWFVNPWENKVKALINLLTLQREFLRLTLQREFLREKTLNKRL